MKDSLLDSHKINREMATVCSGPYGEIWEKAEA
jgi:hypothetical protein